MAKKKPKAFMRFVQWTVRSQQAKAEHRECEPCLEHTLIDDVVILVPSDKGAVATSVRAKTAHYHRESFICEKCGWEIHKI